MNYSSARDNKNPHWITLFRHVRELNDKLIDIANFYLGDYVMARITDKNMLPKATSSIADACLEVTDATIVVMATMRSILHKYKIKNKENKEANEVDVINYDLEHETRRLPESIARSISIPAKEINKVLSFVEVALLLSQDNKKRELEVVLINTVSKIKKLLETELPGETKHKPLEEEKTGSLKKRTR